MPPSSELHDRPTATPEKGRNRTVDLLRAGSVLVVVLGHWLLAVVGHDGERFHGDNLLAVAPTTTWLTWLFQIMPVFFLVGGFANAASWEGARRRQVPYGRWVAARSARMLRPAGAFVVFAVGAVVAARLLGVPADVVGLAGGLVTVPLWFLAAYLPVVAATPALLALHRRHGLAVPVAMAVGAALVDVGHRGLGLPVVGWLNFALVWPFAHQLGFAWRDGTLPRGRRRAVGLLVGGAASLVVLTQVVGYPVAMVGGPGAGETSNAPPSLPLVALAVAQLGAVLLAEGSLERWLTRPRVWTAVAVVNLHAMTLFAWHFAVLVAVTAVALPLRLFPQPEPASLAWWLWRPAWMALLGTVLVVVVALVRHHEHRPVDLGTLPAGGPRAVVGVAAVGLGLTLLALHGLGDGAGPFGLPVGALALSALGAERLGLLPSPARRPVGTPPVPTTP